MGKTVAIIVGAVLLSAGTAWAAEVTGMVTGVNYVERSLVMADGQTYIWGEEVKPEGLHSGKEVTITFEVADGKNMATAIKAVTPPAAPAN